MPDVTVLIPTYNHGPTITRAINSALAQTVQDIEVFVVGDGVPDQTRNLIAEIERRDARVRFFDNPKGPRHGEIYRHQALAEARGKIICYLSDDDLYLPNHLETMQRLLKDHDFANALPLWVRPEGGLDTCPIDLSIAFYREPFRAKVSLSDGAHTLEMYRHLPYGWRTTPQGYPSDRYMWQQFFDDPTCRTTSSAQPSILSFPSPSRVSWTIEERCDELDRWSEKIANPVWREKFLPEVLEAVVRTSANHLAWLNGSTTVRLRDALLSIPITGKVAFYVSRALLWLLTR